MPLSDQIEAILFAAGRPVKINELARAVGQNPAAVHTALRELKQSRDGSGVVVIEKDDRYQLVSAPGCTEAVANFLNAELREKLTDTSLETLAIIVYKQPVSRAEIEAIRGVNSQYILRQLSIRGLIEKVPSTEDSRRLLYRTTLDFMSSLGIQDMKELPDFEELTKSVSLPESTDNSSPSSTSDPAV